MPAISAILDVVSRYSRDSGSPLVSRVRIRHNNYAPLLAGRNPEPVMRFGKKWAGDSLMVKAPCC